jgi:uncharacterized membrane protein YphA (DoxX/SURF4 family)
MGLELVPRLIVGALFIYAGVGKAATTRQVDAFLRELRAYELVPVQATTLMAYSLPALEIIAAACLMVGLWGRESRWLLGAMLAVFTVAKAWALSRGLPIECGCVPRTSFLYPLFNGWTGLATNVVLLALIVVIARAESRRLRRRRPAAVAPASNMSDR